MVINNIFQRFKEEDKFIEKTEKKICTAAFTAMGKYVLVTNFRKSRNSNTCIICFATEQKRPTEERFLQFVNPVKWQVKSFLTDSVMSNGKLEINNIWKTCF